MCRLDGGGGNGGGDDKFSVVTRIHKHLSWDHLHIRTVKLLTRSERERIVITAIISRLNHSKAKRMRDALANGKNYAMQHTKKGEFRCAPLKMITDVRRFVCALFSHKQFFLATEKEIQNDSLCGWRAEYGVKIYRENRKHLFIT